METLKTAQKLLSHQVSHENVSFIPETHSKYNIYTINEPKTYPLLQDRNQAAEDIHRFWSRVVSLIVVGKNINNVCANKTFGIKSNKHLALLP